MTLPTEPSARLKAQEHEIVSVVIVLLGLAAAGIILLGGLGVL